MAEDEIETMVVQRMYPSRRGLTGVRVRPCRKKNKLSVAMCINGFPTYKIVRRRVSSTMELVEWVLRAYTVDADTIHVEFSAEHVAVRTHCGHVDARPPPATHT